MKTQAQWIHDDLVGIFCIVMVAFAVFVNLPESEQRNLTGTTVDEVVATHVLGR